MRKIFTVGILTAFSFELLAGGFQINQQSHKATGMGGAFTGLCIDASSIFYNPGGLYKLKGHQFTGGFTLIDPHVSLQTDANDNIDQTTGNATPFHFYYSGQFINEKLRIGFGVNNQFGSSSSFDDDWEGRFIVQNIGLQTFMFQPTVSYAILDEKLSIGAGFVYTAGNFHYEKGVPLASKDNEYGKATLSGSGNAMGFNVGIFSTPYKLEKEDYVFSVSVGLDYRHKLKMDLDNGNVDFTDIPSSLRDKFPESTGFTSSLTLPAVASGGIALTYEKPERVKVDLLYDLTRTFWSSYDTLAFDFENADTPDSKTPKNWEDVFVHRIGLNITYKEFISIRGGIYMDQSPIPDGRVSPELPDNSHTGYTAGIGVNITDNISVDLSYLRSAFERPNASLTTEGFTASYRRIVNVYGIGINVKFGENKTTETPSIE
jgi:long-chain fatty acid transport protein